MKIRINAIVIILAVCCSSIIFAAGSGETGSATGTGAAVSVKTEIKESPMLAALVKEGKLPPLEKRLPADPLVVRPVDQLGNYGGSLRLALLGNDWGYAGRYMAYEHLVRWTPDWKGIIPNIASKFEVSPDGRSYTFYLRKGIKWSDGQPFSAADFEFWYNDIVMNNDITTNRSGWMSTGGEVFKFEKLDDYTIRYTFKQPFGFFLEQAAHFSTPLYVPAHYLKLFHNKYNLQADEAAKKAGFATWKEKFAFEAGGTASTSANANKPVINAWIWKVSPGQGSATRAYAERNPYYWKTDTSGRQLPYIDAIDWAVLSDSQVLLLSVMNGEIDHIDQHITTAVNKSVLFENKDRGAFRFIETTPTAPNALTIMFNQNHPDPIRRKIFEDKNFRIGMSYAINRKEVIDIVFLGQATAAQVSPRPDSEFYREKMAKQYLEYDVAKANEYLDKAGLTKRDAQGFRLMSNGERLSIIFENDVVRTTYIDALELMKKHWAAVGIDVQQKTMDRSLYEERIRKALLWDATMHRFGGGTGSELLTDPRYFIPINVGTSMYAMAWSTWYTNPKGLNSSIKPEEPPADIKAALAAYDELKTSGDKKRQADLMNKILDSAQERFYTIGICWEPSEYGIAKNNLRNIPNSYPWSAAYSNPAPTNPAQWFFADAGK